MNLLILADIHSNLPALESVFNFINHENIKIDQIFILGDIIGYGPFPNECLEYIQKLPNTKIIAGNHEWAVLNKVDVNLFNPMAKAAVLFTRAKLTKKNLEFINQFEATIKLKIDNLQYLLVHGSPRDNMYEYVLNNYIARKSFEFTDENIILFGHTHICVCYKEKNNEIETEFIKNNKKIKLLPDYRYLINPGSVGQPRDKNPLSAFGIINTVENEFSFYKIEYDIQEVIKFINKFKLPESLGLRLIYGR